jgi:hypothetical protein
MSIERKATWKQDTPRMQLVTLLQSAQGDVGNALSLPMSQVNKQNALQRAISALAEAQDIIRGMPEGDWR